MIEFAVFTREVAEQLIAQGYELKGRTEMAWLFEDSAQLERAVVELIDRLKK